MPRSLSARIAFARQLGLSENHATLLAKLDTPATIQDFITALPANLEPQGDTCYSVATALKRKKAHCIEAAFIAACALWMNGARPLLIDLQATQDDADHVIAPFREGRYWGAISKSNHIWLRWRDPVYTSVRELVMSYFHEYVTGAKKTLRAYSAPFDLSDYEAKEWVTNADHCWDMAATLDAGRHYPLISAGQAKRLRQRDAVEVAADKIRQYRL